MRIVVDTNIAFSAILNTNSKIARILLQPKSSVKFYSTEQLLTELDNHRDKIIQLSDYSIEELEKVRRLITNKIRFIHVKLIPKDLYIKAEKIVKDIDIDDTEFVALTEYIKGKLWTGDKELQKGLALKKWNRIISTEELYQIIILKK
ncbi:PIN domain-containing protein [Bacteroidota bacterium]